jgi:hypothetical protein
MSTAQAWTLLIGLVVITVTFALSLVVAVRVEVGRVLMKIDQIEERWRDRAEL